MTISAASIYVHAKRIGMADVQMVGGGVRAVV